MRKLALLILSAVLIITLCSCGSGFSIRNGLKFGMTAERVVSLEEKENDTIVSEMDYFSNPFTKSGYEASKVAIHNYDNCDIYYYFDDNKTLDSIIYSINIDYTETKSDAYDVFEEIEALLRKQYPKCELIDNHSYFKTYDDYSINAETYYIEDDKSSDARMDLWSTVITGETTTVFSDLMSLYDRNYYVVDASQRLIKCSGGYVEIELIAVDRELYQSVLKEEHHDYHVLLSYSWHSSDIVDSKSPKGNSKDF